MKPFESCVLPELYRAPMQTPFPQIITKSLKAGDDEARCVDAVHLLTGTDIPREVAEWLCQTVDRLVCDDKLALELYMRLCMASGGNTHG